MGDAARLETSARPRAVGERTPRDWDLRKAAVSPLAQRLSPRYLQEHGVLPLEVARDGSLTVGAGTELDPTVVDELSLVYDRPVTVVPLPRDEIQAAILVAQTEVPLETSVADLRESDLQVLSADEDALDDLRALANQAPVIKLVNLTVLDAVRHRASDVHVESTADGIRIRHRIDGVLHDVGTHPRPYRAAVISRIKVMADLDIAERRKPQDGRIRLRLSDREIDVRVSTLPTVHGESVVLRLLDRGSGVRDLDALGMDDATRVRFERLVTVPHGIVLVTGPTGSGKTTTLYAALQRINTPAIKMITVEDPVEYQLEGVTQIPVNAKAGRTFASAMRSILRHDPDVLMVGEMRDRETAEIAIHAALTGHLVFSTLHTNDAPSGITRLLEMGIEPYLLSATVGGLLAQRLVRLVCESCAESYAPSDEERRTASAAGVSVPGARWRRGRGCDACSGTGFRGRTGVYELLVVDDDLRQLVVEGAPLQEFRELAMARGLIPLATAAWAKVCVGLTTPEEVARVTRGDGP